MTEDRSPLHVCGYSARAAVQAAVRCGIVCEGWDCFADRDARQLAPWNQIAGLRGVDFQELLNRPQSVVLPCGGLENRPALWSTLTKRHRVIGPSMTQLRKLRDPRWLQMVCRSSDSSMRFPASCFEHREFSIRLASPDRNERRDRWLLKPRRSGGGIGVREVTSEIYGGDEQGPMRRGEYLQRFVDGDEYSAVVRCGQHARVLFASRPLPSKHPQGLPFAYRGSLGPIVLPTRVADAVLALADAIREQAGFAGVLQVDLIDDTTDSQTYLLEVNPRWSGSMELAELLSPGSLIGELLREQAIEHAAGGCPPSESPDFVAGRVILYADTDVVIDEQLSDAMFAERLPLEMSTSSIRRGGSWTADVPGVGVMVAAGSPVCTLIASGSADQLAGALAAAEQRWRAELRESENRSAAGAM